MVFVKYESMFKLSLINEQDKFIRKMEAIKEQT